MVRYERVEGTDKGPVRLFALSTCVWCKRTRQLLDKLGIAYDYVYADLLEGEAREETITELERWNPRCSFPTLVIGDDRCIVGFREDEIREALA